MNNETINLSTCCKAEATQIDSQGIFETYECSKCHRACEITEVCIDCLGTKEVATDVDDGEGHTMRGVGREVCKRCVISKQN